MRCSGTCAAHSSSMHNDEPGDATLAAAGCNALLYAAKCASRGGCSDSELGVEDEIMAETYPRGDRCGPDVGRRMVRGGDDSAAHRRTPCRGRPVSTLFRSA